MKGVFKCSPSCFSNITWYAKGDAHSVYVASISDSDGNVALKIAAKN